MTFDLHVALLSTGSAQFPAQFARRNEADGLFSDEAQHVAHLLGSHGYIFPIDEHVLTVRNDSAYYRFQVGCLIGPH